MPDIERQYEERVRRQAALDAARKAAREKAASVAAAAAASPEGQAAAEAARADIEDTSRRLSSAYGEFMTRKKAKAAGETSAIAEPIDWSGRSAFLPSGKELPRAPITVGQARQQATAAPTEKQSSPTAAAAPEDFYASVDRATTSNRVSPGQDVNAQTDAVANALRTANQFFGGVNEQQHNFTAADIAARREAENQRNLEEGARLGLVWSGSEGWKRPEDLAGNRINRELGRPVGATGDVVPEGTRYGPGRFAVTKSPGYVTESGGYIGTATPDQVAAARAETAERAKLLGTPGASPYLSSNAPAPTTAELRARVAGIEETRNIIQQRFQGGETGERGY
jgi:hypothetical protein